jgi:phosphoribosylformylglycinamidine synthase
MATRIEVGYQNKEFDSLGHKTQRNIKRDLGIDVENVDTIDVYTIDHDGLGDRQLEKVASELFTDPITQKYAINKIISSGKQFDHVIEIGFKPGVKDNCGDESREGIEDMLDIKFPEGKKVYTATQFLVKGNLTDDQVQKISELLHNNLIKGARIENGKDFKAFEAKVPIVKLSDEVKVDIVDLNVDDDELLRIGKFGIFDHNRTLKPEEYKKLVKAYSDDILKRGDLFEREGNFYQKIRRGPLALDLGSMHIIKNYIGAKTTDITLESIAQTWSEHCKHTIFDAELTINDNGTQRIVTSLYKTYIKEATNKIRKKLGDKDFCVSVFSDNAGVIKFITGWYIAHKVETHNSPSALDPYGGSITGIVGVNRDEFGVGIGAKCIENDYGFCFADPSYKGEQLYRSKNQGNPILHPKVIFEGVRKGVEDGANQSGIPADGFLYFDKSFMGKPLVFVGTKGIIPETINGKDSQEKQAMPGDYIVMAGNRVGRDGIHGATFSSEGMTEGSPVTAVQIGDAITQKKLGDAQLEARDKGLYTSVTDNGAGGLSCSVAEMAKESGGCDVDLEKVLLKYPNMPPNEIWISESQERMTYAVPQEKISDFLSLLSKRGVESCVIGKFTDSGKCTVKYNGKEIMDIGMDFLHDGLPRRKMKATWTPSKHKHKEPNFEMPKDLTETLEQMIARLNICSKEYVTRQYDHEVQGGSVIKPLVGRDQDVKSDARVTRPLLDSKAGMISSQALFPRYSLIDPYHMAQATVDQAYRNILAVGGNIRNAAILDNFCWCSSENAEQLGKLERAARGLHDISIAYLLPMISGKDSMFNDFKGFDKNNNEVKISILETLLISSIGVMDDVMKAQTLDPKKVSDLIYVLGTTRDDTGGSEYYNMNGAIGNKVPTVDIERAIPLYQKFMKAHDNGLFASTTAIGLGGLGVALAKKAMAGNCGMYVNLGCMPEEKILRREDYALFSETPSRFIVTVAQENKREFEDIFDQSICTNIGQITSDKFLDIQGFDGKRIALTTINNIKQVYKRTLGW